MQIKLDYYCHYWRTLETLAQKVMEAKAAQNPTEILEAEIDIVVYQLFGLNDDEIALYRKSHNKGVVW